MGTWKKKFTRSSKRYSSKKRQKEACTQIEEKFIWVEAGSWLVVVSLILLWWIKVILGQPQIIICMLRNSTVMIPLSCWCTLTICWLLNETSSRLRRWRRSSVSLLIWRLGTGKANFRDEDLSWSEDETFIYIIRGLHLEGTRKLQYVSGQANWFFSHGSFQIEFTSVSLNWKGEGEDEGSSLCFSCTKFDVRGLILHVQLVLRVCFLLISERSTGQ